MEGVPFRRGQSPAYGTRKCSPTSPHASPSILVAVYPIALPILSSSASVSFIISHRGEFETWLHIVCILTLFCIEICNEAAAKIMELVHTWRSSYTLRFVPLTMLHVVFSAGTVFLLATVQTESGGIAPSLPHLRSQAKLCITYLSEIGQSWSCANNIRAILENLFQMIERHRAGEHRRASSSSSASSSGAMHRQEGESQLPSPHGEMVFQFNNTFDLTSQRFNVAPVWGGHNYGSSSAISEGAPEFPSAGNVVAGSHAIANHPVLHFGQMGLNSGGAAQDPDLTQWLAHVFSASAPQDTSRQT
jgi:hypothetical protein